MDIATSTDDALIERAQLLFDSFDVGVNDEGIDGRVTDMYNRIIGELLRRGYTQSITLNFSKK